MTERRSRLSEDRTDQILQHSKNELTTGRDSEQGVFRRGCEAIAPAMQCAGKAQAYTEVHIRYGLLMIKEWMEVKAAKPWKLVGQTWEEWAQPNLRRSYKTIDEAIKNIEKFGEGAYEMLEAADLSIRDIIGLRRAITRGEVGLDGHALIVGRDRIDMDRHPEQIQALVSRLREQTHAKDEAIAAKDAELARHKDAAQKLLANQHELIDTQKAVIRRLRELPSPEELQSAEERESWRAAREALEVCGLRIGSLVGLVRRDGATDAFRARIIGQLRAMQTWLNAAIMEAAEILPPDVDLPIEMERQACAISATLTDGQLDTVRQYVAAKSASAGDRGHNSNSVTVS